MFRFLYVARAMAHLSFVNAPCRDRIIADCIDNSADCVNLALLEMTHVTGRPSYTGVRLRIIPTVCREAMLSCSESGGAEYVLRG